MLDPRLLRTDPEAVRANLARRGFSLDVAAFQDIEERRKELQVRVEQSRNGRNVRSKEIGKLKASGADTAPLMATVKQLGEELEADLDYGREILAPIEILGVDSFGDSAVIIKARFKTKPIKQWYVGREFNRRMKKRFDELGIEIPFPHMTLYFGVDKAGQAPPANVTMDAPKLTEALAKGFGDRPSPAATGQMGTAVSPPPPPPPPPAEPFHTPDVRGDSPAESSPGNDGDH